MDFLEKLNMLMDRDSYNKNSLSKASGIPYTTIDNWYKRGYDNLQLPTVKKLCSFFDTSLDFWLKEDIDDPNYGKSNGFIVNFDEMEYIKKYRTLDSHGKDMVDTVLKKEAERIEKSENNPTATITPMRIISYYQRMASAGNGEYLFDDIPTDLIEVENTPLSRKADFVLGINGHSMDPTYYDGDKVLVRKTSDVPVGKIGVFTKNGECYIKELGKDRLISHNKDKKQYPDILPDGKPIDTIGEVLGKV